jgi:hypothetical protein
MTLHLTKDDAINHYKMSPHLWDALPGEARSALVDAVRAKSDDHDNRIPQLSSTDDAAIFEWFRAMARAGLSFHPDDYPSSVINAGTGERVFSDSEAILVNAIANRIRDAVGDRICDIAITAYDADKPRVLVVVKGGVAKTYVENDADVLIVDLDAEATGEAFMKYAPAFDNLLRTARLLRE